MFQVNLASNLLAKLYRWLVTVLVESVIKGGKSIQSTNQSVQSRLGLYRISGWPDIRLARYPAFLYIRYPAGYPVSFAGYPFKLLNK